MEGYHFRLIRIENNKTWGIASRGDNTKIGVTEGKFTAYTVIFHPSWKTKFD